MTDSENDPVKEMRKYIDTFRTFLDKSKIISEASSLTNEQDLDINRVLLVFDIKNQRTYVIKSVKYFFIVNDNKGDVTIALKRSIEMFIYTLYSKTDYFEVRFDNTKFPMKVSKKLFSNLNELNEKLTTL